MLIVTRDGGTYNNTLFELFGLGSGGTITVTKLADLIYNDYESITCVVYLNPNEVGDLVYYDANGDGDQDVGEVGIPNVIVHLLNSTTSDTFSTMQMGFMMEEIEVTSFYMMLTIQFRATQQVLLLLIMSFRQMLIQM